MTQPERASQLISVSPDAGMKEETENRRIKRMDDDLWMRILREAAALPWEQL